MGHDFLGHSVYRRRCNYIDIFWLTLQHPEDSLCRRPIRARKETNSVQQPWSEIITLLCCVQTSDVDPDPDSFGSRGIK